MSEVEKTRKVEQAYNDEKPWGEYTVLVDAPDHKVKTLTVNPGQRLSLQSHRRRQEHWFIVRGEAVVTTGPADGDHEELTRKVLTPGEFIDIPLSYKHRIANEGTEPVVFIEVQTGSYFGEDDNIRYEDDYDRESPDYAGADEDS
jgi:mannose-6-phosphate isomerase-like protein (cupin superfamily)